MRSLLAKLVRYAAVSAISTSLSLAILGALVATRTVSAGWANLIATAVGTVPSFELNRRWVWAKRGRRSLATEILPFWALSLSGLGFSTLAVSLAARAAGSAGWSAAATTLVAEVANVAVFGSLWVLQYLLLDRVLFLSPKRLLSPERPVVLLGHAGVAPVLRREFPTPCSAAPRSPR